MTRQGRSKQHTRPDLLLFTAESLALRVMHRNIADTQTLFAERVGSVTEGKPGRVKRRTWAPMSWVRIWLLPGIWSCLTMGQGNGFHFASISSSKRRHNTNIARLLWRFKTISRKCLAWAQVHRRSWVLLQLLFQGKEDWRWQENFHGRGRQGLNTTS